MAELITKHPLAAEEESNVEDLIALSLTVKLSFCVFPLEFITASNCLGHLKDKKVVMMISILTSFF